MAPEATNGWELRVRKLIPWLWLGLSMVWAVVIFVTDQLAWPLALWIATTVGPLTLLHSRNPPARPDGSDSPVAMQEGEALR